MGLDRRTRYPRGSGILFNYSTNHISLQKFIQERKLDVKFLACLLISGLCSFIQNICAFSLIHRLHQVSYSVASTTKRIFVIFLSIATLRNPVTPLNFFGTVVSATGVFIYNGVNDNYLLNLWNFFIRLDDLMPRTKIPTLPPKLIKMVIYTSLTTKKHSWAVKINSVFT